MKSHRLSLSLVPAFLLAGAAALLACQVPVFRYALERWEPSDYLLRVTPAAGGLTAEERARLESLEKSSPPANLIVQMGEPEETAAAAKVALLTPHRPGETPDPVWEGLLSAEALAALTTSPARQELAARLLTGQSAVWVLIESGDADKDTKAEAALREGFELAAERLELPDGVVTREQAERADKLTHEMESNRLFSDLPLRLEFSVLRVKRDDPAEAALIAMLMRVERDLGDFIAQPMAFPVFGRGRVLEPLIGAGIHPDNVLETGGYLCGACSCEIKELNPGMDLLLAADWSPVDTAPKIESVRITPATDAADKPSRASSLLLPGAAVALVLLLALGFAGFRKSSR